MAKHTVYLTTREEMAIKMGATDAAMEVNEWVSKQVMGFIYYWRESYGLGVGDRSLMDDEQSLIGDLKFNTTERQLMREYDIHGGDIHQSFYNFCHQHNVEPAKVIRLACTKGENWIAKGYEAAGKTVERERAMGQRKTPEQISDETKDYFGRSNRPPLQMNQHEIKAAEHERGANSAFENIVEEMSSLETMLLFLGHERLARELGNHRYGMHSMLRQFREAMAKDAPPASPEPAKVPGPGPLPPVADSNPGKTVGEQMEDAAMQLTVGEGEDQGTGTVGDRRDDYVTTGRR